MSTHYRSFLIVILIGGLGLLICRRVFAPLMISEDDFRRRRNLWLLITMAGFLAPNFWVYASLATITLLYAIKMDSNPVALYPLLLVAIPPLAASIPGLFDLDHQRLLILVVLLPMLPRLLRDREIPGVFKLPTDKFLLAYGLLQVVLMWPYVTGPHSVRLAFLFVLDTWLPYYVLSRVFTRREQLRDAMACFVLTLIILVPLTFAEIRLGTLLYGDFSDNWRIGGLFGYTTRGDLLRAQLSSGQPIVLGFQFAVAIGMWLYLLQHVDGKFWRAVGVATIVLGLVATVSRGPWVGAAVTAAAFALALPQGFQRLVTWGVASGALVLGVAMLSPWGAKLLDYLPFIGGSAQESVDYRSEWLTVSWQLIQQNPLFGNRMVMRQLEFMRTGEGIIDIVNVYVAQALLYGIVGAALFVGVFVSAMSPLVKIAISSQTPEDDRYMAASVLATLVGVLVTIGTVSNYLTIPFIYMMLIGLAVSCTRLFRSENSPVGRMPLNTSAMRAGNRSAG